MIARAVLANTGLAPQGCVFAIVYSYVVDMIRMYTTLIQNRIGISGSDRDCRCP